MKNSMLVFLLLVSLLVSTPWITAEGADAEPGYIIGEVSFPGFATTSLSVTAVGGGATTQKTIYDTSSYQLAVKGGGWNHSVSSSCGLSGGNNNALTVSFNQRNVPVASGATVTNNYVYQPGTVRFQVNITGDPTISSAAASSWATKAAEQGEKTATYSSGTPATSARSYAWDLPVVPNQQIELTANIDVVGPIGTRRYSFSKAAVAPYTLAPRDVAPGELVIVPLEIHFLEEEPAPPAPVYKGTVEGIVDLLGLPSENFLRHTFNNKPINSNPGTHSREYSISGSQYTTTLSPPSTYFDPSIDSFLRWPYVNGVASNNKVTVYPDTVSNFDLERQGGFLTGRINLSGTVQNEDLKAITLNFNGVGNVYDAVAKKWSFLENYYGSATVKRDATAANVKRPSERDYLLFLTTGDWEMSSVTLTRQLSSPAKTSSVTFIDYTTRYNGQTYFGTPIHIEPGTNERDFDYCFGSAIFRFRDPNGQLLSKPTVSGKGMHQTNGAVNLNVSSISATSTETDVPVPEVELFGPPADYSLTTLRVVAADGMTLTFPARNLSLGCNTTKIIDLPGPTLLVTGPAGGTITGAQTIEVSGRAFGGSPISSVAVNGQSATLTPVSGGSANEVGFTYDLALVDGENTITVTVTDMTGAQAADQLFIYVDPWRPTVSIVTPGDGHRFLSTETGIPLLVEAADRGYGFIFSVDLDGALIDSAGGGENLSAPVLLSFAEVLESLTIGEHVVTASVLDRAGNSASSTVTIVIQEPPPVLSGLDDQVVEATSPAGAAASFDVNATTTCVPDPQPTAFPPLVLTAQSNSTTVVGGTVGKTFEWSPITAPDGHTVQYRIQVSDTLDFATVSFSSEWQSATTWTQSLPMRTWYWRVTARDAVHPALESNPAVGNSFSIVSIGAATVANFSVLHFTGCTLSGGVYPSGDTIWAGPFDGSDVDRSFLMFDTSTLGGDATVTSAKLHLDYQVGDYVESGSTTTVYESTWEFPGNSTTYDNLGAYLDSQAIWVGRPLGMVTFNIRPDYIETTDVTRFALAAADEDYESLWNSDPGYSRASSYLEISYTSSTGNWAAPTLAPQINSVSQGETLDQTFQWGEAAAADGDPVQYLLEVSSAANFSTINFSSGWQEGTAWTRPLPAGLWYWRVTARDAVHADLVSSPAASSFRITYEPAPLPPGEVAIACSANSGDIFPLGATTVTCTARDACDRIAEGNFTITVQDTGSPVLTLPPDLLVDATSPSGAPVDFTVMVADSVDTSPEATCLPASGSTFPLGESTVTCTAGDASGNTTVGTFKVRVTAVTPPVLTVPADVTVEATGPLTAVEIGQASADHTLPFTISNDAPQLFPVGMTVVTWTATDTHGNVAVGTQNITVTDTTAPLVTAPAGLTMEATGALMQLETGTATAVDAASVVSITSDAPAAFPVGTTTVTWTATDAAGNIGTAAQAITITDTTPPNLEGLADQTLEAVSTSGANASFIITANDLVDPAPVLTCSAASGSTFPLGKTAVTCTAADASGNSAIGSFTIAVVDSLPPVLTMPADVTVEATSSLTLVNAEATATDIFPFTITNDAPAAFAVGHTPVTWTATDANGNTATGIQNVIVTDTTAPEVAAPADVMLEATGILTPVDIGMATAIDAVGVISVTSDAPAAFPVGTATVAWTAADAAGNIGTSGQTVIVADTTPPVLAGLLNQTLEASSAAGVMASFTVTASDLVDPAPAVTCSAASGTTFPLGETAVACTAADAHGNIASGSLILTVRDTTPPVLTVPASITVLLNTPIGSPEVQAFLSGASAVDSIDEAVTITATAPQDLATVGAKQVTFTAVDDSGNQTTGTGTIHVVYGGGNEFLSPVALHKPFKLGSTVPVKIEFHDASGAAVTTAVVRMYLYPVSGDVPAEEPIEIESTSSADTGNCFRISEGVYIYNLSTKTLSVGTYQVRAALDDGSIRTVSLALKQ